MHEPTYLHRALEAGAFYDKSMVYGARIKAQGTDSNKRADYGP